MMSEIFKLKSKCRCPKCKSINIEIIEVWNGATISWRQAPDKTIDKEDGTLEPGNPDHVEGYCVECEKRWTFRGVLQISDLFIL